MKWTPELRQALFSEPNVNSLFHRFTTLLKDKKSISQAAASKVKRDLHTNLNSVVSLEEAWQLVQAKCQEFHVDVAPLEEWMQKQITEAPLKNSQLDKGKYLAERTIWENEFAENIKPLGQLIDEGIPEIEWLVSKMVKKGGITFIVGLPGSIKTWLAMRVALSIASGEDLFNLNSQKASIMYLDEELGQVTVINRFHWLAKGHAITDLNDIQVASFQGWQVNTPQGERKLDTLFDIYEPQVLVIDSFVRCLAGDENFAGDVSRFFQVIKKYDCTKIIIHHTPKDGKGARGSGDILGACDVMLISRLYPGSQTAHILTEKNNSLPKEDWCNILVELAGFKDDDGQTDMVRLNFKSDYQESKKIPEQAREVLKEWSDAEDIEFFAPKDAIKVLDQNGYNTNAWNRAKKLMIDSGEIRKINKLKWQFITEGLLVNLSKTD